MIPAGLNQSRKAATTISKVDYWIVTEFTAFTFEKSSVSVEVTLEVRNFGKVFRAVETESTSTGHTGKVEFNPYLVIPANSDIRLTAIASAANADVGGDIQGYLAIAN
jgi:expansin (peptidoglycan-binding protein)